MDYTNIVNAGLTHNDGLDNAAGLQENALIILINDLKTEAVPDPAAVTPAGLITIAGDHKLNVGATPIPCFSITEKSDLEATLVGEIYSMTNETSVTLFIPQTSASNVGQFSRLKNARMMVLIGAIGESGYLQIGTKALSGKVKSGSVKRGKGPTGEKGITLTVNAYSVHPYYQYNGAIPAA